MTSEAVQEKIHRGIAASPGFAIGKVLVVKDGGAAYTEPPKSAIAPEAVSQEIQRFEEALEKTRNDLTALQTQLQEKVNAAEARILDAHLLILDDQMLQNEVTSMIRNQSCNAEYAFYKIVERYVKAIMMMSDNYIKERAADIRDVAARVLAHLQNFHKIALNELLDQRIIIADELTPSDTAALDRSKVLGFAITTGSKTSHTAILARRAGLAVDLPLVSAAALAVLEVIERENILANCRKMAAFLQENLEKLTQKYAFVKAVRSCGLMIGIVLDREAAAVLPLLLKNGMIALTAGETVIRLLPRLNLTQEEAEYGLAILEKSLDEYAAGL